MKPGTMKMFKETLSRMSAAELSGMTVRTKTPSSQNSEVASSRPHVATIFSNVRQSSAQDGPQLAREAYIQYQKQSVDIGNSLLSKMNQMFPGTPISSRKVTHSGSIIQSNTSNESSKSSFQNVAKSSFDFNGVKRFLEANLPLHTQPSPIPSASSVQKTKVQEDTHTVDVALETASSEPIVSTGPATIPPAPPIDMVIGKQTASNAFYKSSVSSPPIATPKSNVQQQAKSIKAPVTPIESSPSNQSNEPLTFKGLKQFLENNLSLHMPAPSNPMPAPIRRSSTSQSSVNSTSPQPIPLEKVSPSDNAPLDFNGAKRFLENNLSLYTPAPSNPMPAPIRRSSTSQSSVNSVSPQPIPSEKAPSSDNAPLDFNGVKRFLEANLPLHTQPSPIPSASSIQKAKVQENAQTVDVVLGTVSSEPIVSTSPAVIPPAPPLYTASEEAPPPLPPRGYLDEDASDGQSSTSVTVNLPFSLQGLQAGIVPPRPRNSQGQLAPQKPPRSSQSRKPLFEEEHAHRMNNEPLFTTRFADTVSYHDIGATAGVNREELLNDGASVVSDSNSIWDTSSTSSSVKSLARKMLSSTIGVRPRTPRIHPISLSTLNLKNVQGAFKRMGLEEDIESVSSLGISSNSPRTEQEFSFSDVVKKTKKAVTSRIKEYRPHFPRLTKDTLAEFTKMTSKGSKPERVDFEKWGLDFDDDDFDAKSYASDLTLSFSEYLDNRIDKGSKSSEKSKKHTLRMPSMNTMSLRSLKEFLPSNNSTHEEDSSDKMSVVSDYEFSWDVDTSSASSSSNESTTDDFEYTGQPSSDFGYRRGYRARTGGYQNARAKIIKKLRKMNNERAESKNDSSIDGQGAEGGYDSSRLFGRSFAPIGLVAHQYNAALKEQLHKALNGKNTVRASVVIQQTKF